MEDRMFSNSITASSRAALVAFVSGAAAFGLAMGTAQAAPDGPKPPTSAGTLYGDPQSAARFWRHQEFDDDCVPMSVADVVGQITGNQPSELAIVDVAHATPSTIHSGPVYTLPIRSDHGGGAAFGDESALLARYGIRAVSTDKESAEITHTATGMEALEQYMSRGQKVIVAVNAELIWGRPVKDKRKTGEPKANHAVVVTGVDTARGMVHLNDTGSTIGRDATVPIDVFAAAWGSSDNQMTVTA
jgi:hypothetical protein